ncbi:bifunctional demethylmenaquinone methyltransferase/2-methoxy-6-polyprenyl-1,4-benzoquinol methylase, partial [Rickettsiales endosymbiont of Peranema trichophorum]|uniref:class I SAM-dependent methyltransferase n=1 Tax=Rickettsiales endosymbiont of Peranema trichophorum TaxID=2486577 RepID=UPI0010E5CA26
MDEVSFGFQKVDRAKKRILVEEVFDGVADKYDVMNDIISLGVQRCWKGRLIDEMFPVQGANLI